MFISLCLRTRRTLYVSLAKSYQKKNNTKVSDKMKQGTDHFKLILSTQVTPEQSEQWNNFLWTGISFPEDLGRNIFVYEESQIICILGFGRTFPTLCWPSTSRCSLGAVISESTKSIHRWRKLNFQRELQSHKQLFSSPSSSGICKSKKWSFVLGERTWAPRDGQHLWRRCKDCLIWGSRLGFFERRKGLRSNNSKESSKHESC